MSFIPFTKTIAPRISGGTLDIKGFTFGNPNHGPRLYIQGGIHGGEVTFWIFHRLMRHIEEINFKGSVTVVPIANPIAWQQRAYFYTAGKFNMYNGKDWNRSYPGNKNGRLEEVLAHHLFAMAKEADMVVDLHTADWSNPYLIVSDEPAYLQIAQAIKAPFTSLFTKSPANKGALTTGPLDEVAKKGIVYECGRHDTYNQEHIDMVVDGLKRLLGYLGHTNTQPNTEPVMYARTRVKITTDQAGFIDYKVLPGARFKKSDHLYTVYPTGRLGEEVQYLAREDGFMVVINPTHTMWVGDRTIEYVPAADLKYTLSKTNV